MITTLKTGIKDIMSTEVITVNVNMPFTNAMRMFGEINKHYLPVVNDKKELIGIFSAKDALRAMNRALFNVLISNEEQMNEHIKVYDIMTNDELYFLNHDDTVDRALILFKEFKIGMIPVLDELKIVGQLSIYDIVDIID